MKPSLMARLSILAALVLTLGLGATDVAFAAKGGKVVSSTTTVVNSKSVLIDGAVGGTIKCGSWTLELPAGVFAGSATVTVADLGGAEPMVDLSISDESKNNFKRPVWLSYKFKNGNEAAGKAIHWWNPMTRQWDEVPGFIIDLLGGELKVPLFHFSTYKAGKAGW